MTRSDRFNITPRVIAASLHLHIQLKKHFFCVKSLVEAKLPFLVQDAAVDPSLLHFTAFVKSTQPPWMLKCGRCRRKVRSPIHEVVKAIILGSVAARGFWSLRRVGPPFERCSGSHIHNCVLRCRAGNTDIPWVAMRCWGRGVVARVYFLR